MNNKILNISKENVTLILHFEDKTLVDFECDDFKTKSEFMKVWEVLSQLDFSRVSTVYKKNKNYFIKDGTSKTPLSYNQFFRKMKLLLISVGYGFEDT